VAAAVAEASITRQVQMVVQLVDALQTDTAMQKMQRSLHHQRKVLMVALNPVEDLAAVVAAAQVAQDPPEVRMSVATAALVDPVTSLVIAAAVNIQKFLFSQAAVAVAVIATLQELAAVEVAATEVNVAIKYRHKVSTEPAAVAEQQEEVLPVDWVHVADQALLSYVMPELLQ
jgi:hypothetical protein